MATISPSEPLVRGPLAVRWLGCDLPPQRAGALAIARVVAENAGTASWRSHDEPSVWLSYHWLDPLGNPIQWNGLFSPLPAGVPAGERVEIPMYLRAPMPPGRYRLALDLVAHERCWFSEVGNPLLELDVEVLPRLAARTLAVSLRAGPPELVEQTQRALAMQEEPIAVGEAAAVAHLAPGCLPAPDWSRRVLDLHEEGFAVVGGSLRRRALFARRGGGRLAPWAPGTGRRPGFDYPLLCPSVVSGIDVSWVEDVEGLPAARPPADEPAMFDGRIVVELV